MTANDLSTPTITEAELACGPAGTTALRKLIDTVLSAFDQGATRRHGPLPLGTPDEIAERINSAVPELVPRHGVGAVPSLELFGTLLAAESADPAHPACLGHLHCPPLAVAVAADLVASTINSSLDSWDQAPAATVLESALVTELAGLAGYSPQRAGGVFTSGGTESNLMGLLLARAAAIRLHCGVEVAQHGLPHEAVGRLRIYTSEAAHFSVQRSAALLGLGESAVVPISVDHAQRMDRSALRAELRRGDTIPMAIVATAGTTDFGAIDPLPELRAIADEYRCWLHVDAAYGGGALFSSRLAHLLDGIADADSLALDFHKFGWQPIAAGLFLAKDSGTLTPLSRQVAYLNPLDDEEAGYTSLLHHSLRTSRRPDLLKLLVTLRALGREGIGELVDTCHDLAGLAATHIEAHPRLELAAEPVLSTVVFRYRAPGRSDEINAALRRRLLAEGTAVVGRTDFGDGPDRLWLKLTLLNPHTTPMDITTVLEAVVAAGDSEVSR